MKFNMHRKSRPKMLDKTNKYNFEFNTPSYVIIGKQSITSVKPSKQIHWEVYDLFHPVAV